MAMSADRMNCNLFRAVWFGYVKEMGKYCNAFGWKYFWKDTFKIGKAC